MPKTATHSAKRALIVTTASLAWFALLLQLLLTIRTSLSNGMSIIAAIAMYFSFFTITTNLLVALVLTFSLLATKSPWGRFFSNPVTTTGTALYIATVGIIYSLLLRHTWNPEGLNKLTDLILHDVVPLLLRGRIGSSSCPSPDCGGRTHCLGRSIRLCILSGFCSAEPSLAATHTRSSMSPNSATRELC